MKLKLLFTILVLSLIFGLVYGVTFDNSFNTIFYELRLPRLMTALFVGGGVALGGLLIQCYFQNPLASPHILGINSGSMLLISLWYLISQSFLHLPWVQIFQNIGLITFSMVGAILMLILTVFISRKLGSNLFLIIVGIFFSQLVSGLLNVILSFSDNESLKALTYWSFGTFQRVSLGQLPYIFLSTLMPIVFISRYHREIDLIGLGEEYALSSGLDFKGFSWKIVLVTGFSSAIIASFCGPIGFVGLAATHFARLLSNSEKIIPLAILSFVLGALMCITCENINLILESYQIPLNALLGILGGPIILVFIWKLNYREQD